MVKLVLWIAWCVLGFCVALSGCRAVISAEKLEASCTVHQPGQQAPPTIEVHYDPNGNRP